MDEPELLTEMAALVGDGVSDRKRRLFAVACLSRFADHLEDPRSLRALRVAERYAHGQATEAERRMAEDDAFDAHAEMREARFGLDSSVPWTWQGDYLTRVAVLVVSDGYYFAEDAANYLRRTLLGEAEEKEEAIQLSYLREILGPAAPLPIDPAWLLANDCAAFHLTTMIEATRDFALLPILADALEDAGCDWSPLLDHCRQPGDHLPGGWGIDALLGKS